MKSMRYAIPAMLLLSALLLSCGGEAGQTTEDTNNTPATTEAVTEDTSYRAEYLPEVDYNGYEYRIIGYSDHYTPVIEKETGAIIDDVIYRRNKKVEEQYNVKLTATLYPFTDYLTVSELVTKAGRAQSDDLDLAHLIFRDAYNSVLDGIVPAATALPIVDLEADDRPWYNQSMNESITIDGVGLFCYTALDNYPSGGCLFFNKQIITELDLDDPYAMVDDGTWTMDAVYKMGQEAILDIDGNGKYAVGDRFAFISEWDTLSMLAYTGTGTMLVEMVDGIPTVSQNERLIEAFSKLQEYAGQPGFFLDTFNQFGWAESSRTEGINLFAAGQSLFIVGSTNTLTKLGDMKDDYGIVPHPKWNEEQGRYYCEATAKHIYVPLACSADLERTMVIKEALAVESLNLVYPAYYDNALKNRYIRDEESLRMLDLIMNTTVLDLGQDPFWDIIRTPWLDTLQSGKPNFASKVEKNLKKSQKALDELMAMVDAIK